VATSPQGEATSRVIIRAAGRYGIVLGDDVVVDRASED
jgi:hypothetical protein